MSEFLFWLIISALSGVTAERAWEGNFRMAGLVAGLTALVYGVRWLFPRISAYDLRAEAEDAKNFPTMF